MGHDLYESDFYSWTIEQAALLRSGAASSADLMAIAEEIETLGRSEASALESAYRLVCMHLLKALLQPEKATPSWRHTILENRLKIARLLKANPGLKPRRSMLFQDAYVDAVKQAAEETGLPPQRFSVTPPFTIEEVESETFKPAGLIEAGPRRPPRARSRRRTAED